MGNTKKILWIGVGVVVILLIVVCVAVFYKKKPTVSPSSTVPVGSVTPPTQDLTPLKGVLPPNFPVALLVGSSPTIVASGYSYNQKTSTDSWVVTATSSESLASFAKAYDAYFKTNSWTVVQKTQTATQLYYFASNPKTFANVNITINALPNSTSNYIDINLNEPHAQ